MSNFDHSTLRFTLRELMVADEEASAHLDTVLRSAVAYSRRVRQVLKENAQLLDLPPEISASLISSREVRVPLSKLETAATLMFVACGFLTDEMLQSRFPGEMAQAEATEYFRSRQPTAKTGDPGHTDGDLN